MKISYAAAMLGILLAANPAVAQSNSQGEALLTAVKDHDGAKLMELVNANGAGFLNARGFDGSTALTLAVQARNSEYTDYLLTRGADPNFPGTGGEPPMVIAARQGWAEGIDHLLIVGARSDATNRQGETALIVAVQLRNTPLVRRLLAAGANPDKSDSSAGMSARDYAKRDNRARDILTMIEHAKPAPAPKH